MTEAVARADRHLNATDSGILRAHLHKQLLAFARLQGLGARCLAQQVQAA